MTVESYAFRILAASLKMTTESNTKILPALILLHMLSLVSTHSYPFFGEGQYFRGIPIRSYIPVPVTQYRNEYHLPEYDDGIIGNPQDDFEYYMYDKYPYSQYYAFRPELEDYYYDKYQRRNLNGYGYYDNQVPRDIVGGMTAASKTGFYPYAQESWYEEDFPRYDSNAKANAAFIQNLILAQMYLDSRNQFQPVYDSSDDDYDDQHWMYGIPSYEPDEKNMSNEYKEDEDVKELESLARKSESNAPKEKNPAKTHKFRSTKGQIKHVEELEKPTKSKSKMTDDEYFDLQKQIIVNSRKNKYTSVFKPLKFNEKQFYNPDEASNFWDSESKKSLPSYLEAATNSIKKINVNNNNNNNNPKSLKEIKNSDSQKKIEASSAPTTTSTPYPKRPASLGQKEVVLPRPSNPVRKPFSQSARSMLQPSIYEELEKLLNINKDFHKGTMSRPQKRFVLSEDQLTAQLTGLKKFSD